MGKQKSWEWEYVSIVKKKDRGMHIIQCKYCSHVFVGGPHRIRAHLLGLKGQGVDKCHTASTELKQEIRRLAFGTTANVTAKVECQTLITGNVDVASSHSKPVAAGSSTSISVNSTQPPFLEGGSSSKKKRVVTGGTAGESQAWKLADEAIRRFFYAEGIPYEKVESPFFLDMIRAISAIPSYKPPTSFELRTKHFNDEMKCVEAELLRIRETWKTYGCTIVSDGWSDTRNRPIINILASSIHGTVFLRSIDTNGQYKSGEFIFGILKEVILDVGPSNVVQVCMEDAPNCVAAGHMIETEWPSIFFTRCSCHCLDLLFEDIAKCVWVNDVMQSALKITKFITRKQYVFGMFRKYSEKSLLKPSTTRFAYNFIMLSNLVDEKVSSGLKKMVVSEQWCQWKGSNTQEAIEMVSIVSNDSFWADINMIVKVCKPILKILRLVDREGATMGLLHDLLNRTMEEINNMTEIDPMKLDEIKGCCKDRWSMLHSPLHAVGFLLHPLWGGIGQNDHEVNTGWFAIITRYGDGNEVLQGALLDELHDFSTKANEMFRLPIANDLDRRKNPIRWWQTFGTCSPNLRKLAIRVLSQGSCASPCERNWSAFSLVHAKRRSRSALTSGDKLGYLKNNLRLMKRIKERRFSLMEITFDMIDEEGDEDRLLILQKRQEEPHGEDGTDDVDDIDDIMETSE